jgi:serine/threonine protein kinase
MGEVYAGLDLETDRPVAIKRLRPELAAVSEETVGRFAREAAILHRLDHPNVVKILAFERSSDHHDIVMELVAGGSLRDLLRSEGRLPVPRVLRMMLELSDALSRAHHLGVIHRDIKPENVLLAADGTPRLADFGLARMGDESIGAPNALLGTIAYLSPEALWGRALDERSDLWGLGVTLFEMLSGRRPFEGESHGAVMTAILHQPTPDLRAVCDASTPLVELVSRMLEKEPSRRTSSARQVGAEIEALLQARASA